MDKSFIAIGLSVVAIVIAAVAFNHTIVPTSYGNTTQSFWDAALGYKVNGTAVINSAGLPTGPGTGTCALIGEMTIAASTTVSRDCAISGIVSGDILFAQFATSTVNGNGWSIVGASASTTSGFGTFRITNWTGAAGTIPGSIASTTQYSLSR